MRIVPICSSGGKIWRNLQFLTKNTFLLSITKVLIKILGKSHKVSEHLRQIVIYVDPK